MVRAFSAVVTPGTPTIVLLGHDVWYGRPGTLGAARCVVLQHALELGFGDSKPVRWQSPWSAGDRWARYSPDVMDSVVAHFTLDSGWASEVWEFGEEAVDQCAASDGLDAWDQWSGCLGQVRQ
jgi:hypothetical protein